MNTTLILIIGLVAVGLWWRSATSGSADHLNSHPPDPFQPGRDDPGAPPAHSTGTRGAGIGRFPLASGAVSGVGQRASRPLQVIDVQRKAISTFSGLLVRTIGEKGFISGNAVRISISPEAWAVTRPLRSKVEDEVERAILAMAKREGWQVPSNLSVALAVDEQLSRLEMRGESMLDDGTAPAAGESLSDPPDLDATQPQLPRLINLAGSSDRCLVPGEPLIVGRSATVSDWVIANDYLSSAHAVFEVSRKANGWSLSVLDRNSSNGTKVGATSLKPLTPHPLSDGDVVVLGPAVRLRVDLIG